MSEQSSDSTTATVENGKTKKTKLGLKYGSLQYFVRADDVASNFSSDLFSADEVHKIGILDLRILNLDRNDGNLLVKKQEVRKNKKSKTEYKLIPIDHSLSIPDNLEVYSYDICWMDWEQSHASFSQESLKYIKKIDVLKDIKMLDNTFKFRKICLRNIRITGILLKKGAEAGMTLHQIGSLLCRSDDYDDEPEPSVLEKIVSKAQEMACTIRKIKSTHLKAKLDAVEDFKNRRRARRTSLNNKSPDEMVSKLLKHQTKNDTHFRLSPDQVKVSNPFQEKLSAIEKGFAAFEESEDTEPNSEEKQSPFLIPEINLTKVTSHRFTKQIDTDFDLKKVGQKMGLMRRERTQSENDTEFMFEYRQAAASPKKFRQKQEPAEANELEEEKIQFSKDDNHQSSDGSSESSESSDEEGDSDEVKKSPPLKRTVSLPKIKMLESNKGLPKIKEEEEEETEPTLQKGSSDESDELETKKNGKEASSGDLVRKKHTPIKFTRQKSEDVKESKLKDSPYDEDFFYYYELYLEETIKKITAASQKLVQGRNRSRSEVY